jgi:4-carboxymuconolactone decarboxylase
MRAPAIPPAEIGADLQPLYDDMRQGIERSFKGFVAIREDGALVGPWAPWLRPAKFGEPIWELVKAIGAAPSLPAAVREVAILVTGAHFRSGYELYAHVIVAEGRGLSDEKLETIVAGQRPSDLTREEGIAYDMFATLVRGARSPSSPATRQCGRSAKPARRNFPI